MFKNTPPPPPEKRAAYEIVCKRSVEQGRPQMTLWRMRTVGCIPKARNTHTEHAIFIAFPLKQWLHERASLLRYTYIASIVVNKLKCSEGKKLNNSNTRHFLLFRNDAHNYKITGILKLLKFRRSLRHVSVHAGSHFCA
jgi:hypothetical protein